MTAGMAALGFLGPLASRCTQATPLLVGIGPQGWQVVHALTRLTTKEARILWEDFPAAAGGARWTPLLPVLTGRDYIGGLAPDVCIEHAYSGLVDGTLAGRPVGEWSDAELEDFCGRYNIGWAVCRSPASVNRFRKWKASEFTAMLAGSDSCCLFTLCPRSFVLKGGARWLGADCRHVALADVVPDDGQVVLSLHYQTGLQASPARVQIEREPDPQDPIPFIRLRMPGPVARVTLTWSRR
jgi:hypothetical protein